MTDLLVAMLAVGLLGAAALALLAAVTVVPFVLTLQRADRYGVSTPRAGAVALVGSSVGLLAAVLLTLRTAVPVPLAALPLVLAALGPVAVSAAPRRLGRRGRHESRAA
jgi:hypothetical protein